MGFEAKDSDSKGIENIINNIDHISEHAEQIALNPANGFSFVTIYKDGKRIVDICYSTDQILKELTIEAAYATDKTVDVTKLIIRHFSALAKGLGFKALLFETKRLGLVRKTMKEGFELRSYTLIKKL